MAFLKQSTAYTRSFFLVNSSDHVSAKTGVTATVNISKAGGAFGVAAGTVTEIANGWYKVALTSADTGTLGDLAFHITGSGADDTDFVDQIVAFDPAIATPTNFNLLSIDANGRVDVIKLAGTTQTARDIGASVLLSAGTGTGQLDFTSGVVKANLAQILGTALTETAGQIAAAFKQFFDVATPTGTMKAITNVVTATNVTTLSAGSISTGSFVAGAVNATVAPNLDAAVTSRMATYTQPTGFLAATFPAGTIANTTNITAGTVTTATNVTTVNDKTGYRLSATGVDDILDETAVTYVGKPDTLRKLVWFMRKIWANKRKNDKLTNHQIYYEDDGTTPMLDAVLTNDSNEATRGASS